MSTIRHKWAALLLALSLVLGLAACGGDPNAGANAATGQVTVHPLLWDVSLSGADAGTEEVVEADLAQTIETTALPGKLVVTGFNHRAGSVCQPLVIDLAAQRSGQQADELRASTIAALPATLKRYATCLTDADTGAADGGSEIFGALHQALSTAEGDTLTVFSDGCEFSRLPQTCVRRNVMLAPGFTDSVLDNLPTQLLSVTTPVKTIEFVGLGANSNLDAEALVVLRATWVAYTQRLGLTAVTR